MSFFVARLNRMADAMAISRNKTSPAAVDASPRVGDRPIRHIAPRLAAAAIGVALVLAPVASAAPGNAGDGSGTPGHVAPSPYGSGTSPFVGSGTWAPGDQVPYDPYIKNPGGGVDLAS